MMKYETNGPIMGGRNKLVLIEENKKLREALSQIESWTRNPREYEPSLYTLHHICKNALEELK